MTYDHLKTAHQELLHRFQNHLRILGYSHSTCQLTPCGVAQFLQQIELEGIALWQCQPVHVKGYYGYLLQKPGRKGTLSPATIENYLYALRLFFSFALQEGIINTHPMATLRFPRQQVMERAIINQAEVKQLWASCRTYQEQAILGLFYSCGLRRIEAERLDIRDVVLRTGWLYVRSGKGQNRRVVPIYEQAKTAFKAYLYEERPRLMSRFTEGRHAQAFMLNQAGTRMRGLSFWRLFKRMLKYSGNENLKNRGISLHALRHSIATHLLENGMDIEQLQDFLGHKKLETTQIYTRVNTLKL
jgi:integrase/recombinase XerD